MSSLWIDGVTFSGTTSYSGRFIVVWGCVGPSTNSPQLEQGGLGLCSVPHWLYGPGHRPQGDPGPLGSLGEQIHANQRKTEHQRAWTSSMQNDV